MVPTCTQFMHAARAADCCSMSIVVGDQDPHHTSGAGLISQPAS